jgi:peptidoglycan/LPS O-acetylase OafA/YrhL
MTDSNKTQGRLFFLDFLRGIAALAVCFEHAGYRLWSNFREITHTYFSFGKFGVAAFFLTSGFVIPYSLENNNSLSRFWVSRFFRLYPLYWLSIVTAVTLMYCGVTDETNAALSRHLVRTSLINLTMFQEYVGTPDVIGLYYTLAMEMAFYIAFSLLFLGRVNRRSLPIAWLTSGTLFVLAISVPLVMHRRVPLAGLFYVVCLSVGTCIYRNFTGEASNKSVIALLCFITLSVPMEIYCNYVLIKKDDPLEHYTLWAVLIPWAAAYIVFVIAYLLRGHRFPKVFVWLGLISYSVYLLHPPLQALIPVWPNPAYSLLAMLALTLGVSACTYRFVERPGIAFGKYVYARIEAGSGGRSPTPAQVIGGSPIKRTPARLLR